MSEAGSLVVGGLPGRNAATTTITTKTMPPSAPHRSHLLSSMVPLLFPADVPQNPSAEGAPDATGFQAPTVARRVQSGCLRRPAGAPRTRAARAWALRHGRGGRR